MNNTISGKVEILKGDVDYFPHSEKSLFVEAYVFDLTLKDNTDAGTKLREQIKKKNYRSHE